MSTIENQAVDPAVHRLCLRIARRLVLGTFAGILMDHEKAGAIQETYSILHEELSKPKPAEEV